VLQKPDKEKLANEKVIITKNLSFRFWLFIITS
jgi:hypothetical protein